MQNYHSFTLNKIKTWPKDYSSANEVFCSFTRLQKIKFQNKTFKRRTSNPAKFNKFLQRVIVDDEIIIFEHYHKGKKRFEFKLGTGFKKMGFLYNEHKDKNSSYLSNLVDNFQSIIPKDSPCFDCLHKHQYILTGVCNKLFERKLN